MQAIKKIFPPYSFHRAERGQTSLQPKIIGGHAATRQAMACRVGNREFDYLWRGRLTGLVQVDAQDDGGVGALSGGTALVGDIL